MPGMIWLAIVVEAVQREWVDFGVLLLLQIINGVVGFYEERNAGNAIAALKASLAPKANVKRDAKYMIIAARDLVVGDIVLLRGGVAATESRRVGDARA